MPDRLQRLSELGLVELDDWQTDPPVQVTGVITPEGRAFYLRLRSGGAQLEVHSSADRNSPQLWEGEVDYTEQPDPCSFPATIIAAAAAELLRRWRSGAPSSPGWSADR